MKGLDGHFGGGIVGRVSQQVLPLLPADAVAIGPVAGLVENADGGVVFVSGLATFAFAADDEVGRRLAAVQLVATEIASAAAVAAAFGIGQATVWRWKTGFDAAGVAGLIPAKCGPKGPTKLTAAMAARIRALAAEGHTRTAIAAAVEVSPATVRVALGRRAGSAGWQARHAGSPAGWPAQAVAPACADSSAGWRRQHRWPARSRRHDAAAGTEVADPVAATPAGDRRDEPGRACRRCRRCCRCCRHPSRAPASGRWPAPGSWSRRRWCSRKARTCRWPGCC